MENTNELQDSQEPVEEVESQETETTGETPSESPKTEEVIRDESQLVARTQKAEEKAKQLEVDKANLQEKLEKANQTNTGENPSLGVDDFIEISASLEGLDQREKEYLTTQHKQTGKSLNEIKTSEDFGLWQSAYRDKVEKNKALDPTNEQGQSDKPQNFVQQLANASIEEKERLLSEVGMYKSPQKRNDINQIGA